MPKAPAKTKRSVEELKQLEKDLRRYSKLPAWHDRIKAELRGPVREAEAKVKSKILSIPSRVRNRGGRGGRQESLRQKMVRATKSNVETTDDLTGGFVWVDARSMPSGEENLPAYMEGIRRYTRWRHMVFGDPDVWVTQRAHPYFRRTLRPYEAKSIAVAEKVIDQVKRDLERG